MSKYSVGEKRPALNEEGFQQHVERHCVSCLERFKKTVRSYIFFHLSCIGLLTLECLFLFLFLTPLFAGSLFALALAVVVATAFGYITGCFYLEAKKPSQLLALRNRFMLLCRRSLPQHLLRTDYHLSLARAAYHFNTHLGREEEKLERPSVRPPLFQEIVRRLSSFYHKGDVKKMREMLFLVSIHEHMQLIKKAPTSLEAHASLAHGYVALSHLYRGEDEERFHAATLKAVQGFKIMDHYQPGDPWIHAQLASCYHDLHRTQEEIASYEEILRISPDDVEVVFRLGILYFQEGDQGKGLQMYEILQAKGDPRAGELIHFYDATASFPLTQRSS